MRESSRGDLQVAIANAIAIASHPQSDDYAREQCVEFLRRHGVEPPPVSQRRTYGEAWEAEILPPGPLDDGEAPPAKTVVRYDPAVGMTVVEGPPPPDVPTPADPLMDRVRERVVKMYRAYRDGAPPPLDDQICALIRHARSVLPPERRTDADAVVEAVEQALRHYLSDKFGEQFGYSLQALAKSRKFFAVCWQAAEQTNDAARNHLARRRMYETAEAEAARRAEAERLAERRRYIETERRCPICRTRIDTEGYVIWFRMHRTCASCGSDMTPFADIIDTPEARA